MAKQSVIDLEKDKNSAKRTELNAPTFDYKESKGAEQNWDAYNHYRTTQKPASAQGTWTDSLNKTVNQIMNKEKFSYDLSADALYQQYKDQAIRNGNLAMMDTMGQAQAMTGGYGNSYAQSVGQQAYNSYLQQLDDKVPELYKLALDQYNQEVQNLYDKAGLLWKMDDSEYGKSQDALNNYYKELGVLFDNAKYMSDTEYNRALDNFKIMYNSHRNAVSDDQWQQKFDEGIRQFDVKYGVSGISGYTDDDTTVSAYDNGGVATAGIKRMQDLLGVTADGKWGAQSRAAAKKEYGTDDPAELYKKLVGNAFKEKERYADWDAGDWEGYLAQIRQKEGKAAALEELNYLTSKGLIPQGMVTYAAIGARGGQMGH
jgi:hypothetical protein